MRIQAFRRMLIRIEALFGTQIRMGIQGDEGSKYYFLSIVDKLMLPGQDSSTKSA